MQRKAEKTYAEALQTIHGYVAKRAHRLRKYIDALMHIPGLYRRVPAIAAKGTRKTLGHGNDRCDFCIKLTED